MTPYGYTQPPGFKLEALALIRGLINGARVIADTATVLEAGAGFGTVTTVLSRLARHVTAVEALPDSIEENRIRCAFTPNITHIQAALVPDSFTGTSVPVHRYPNPMMSSTREITITAAEVLNVPALRLADVPNVDTLVMDIEGAETDIILGSDLSRFHTIVLEWHPHAAGQDAVDKARAALHAGRLRQVASTPSWGNGASFDVFRR